MSRLPTLKSLVHEFRILDDWEVRWGRGSNRNRCFTDTSRKLAIIYPWDSQAGPENPDYRFHEVLHVAIKALIYGYPNAVVRAYAGVEENLVQDVCYLIREGKCGFGL